MLQDLVWPSLSRYYLDLKAAKITFRNSPQASGGVQHSNSEVNLVRSGYLELEQRKNVIPHRSNIYVNYKYVFSYVCRQII